MDRGRWTAIRGQRSGVSRQSAKREAGRAKRGAQRPQNRFTRIPPELRTPRLQDHKTTGLRDYETTGLRDHGTTGLRDYETTGLRDYGTTDPIHMNPSQSPISDLRASGFSFHLSSLIPRRF